MKFLSFSSTVFFVLSLTSLVSSLTPSPRTTSATLPTTTRPRTADPTGNCLAKFRQEQAHREWLRTSTTTQKSTDDEFVLI